MSKLFEHLETIEDWANEHHNSKEVWEHSIPIQEALERLEAIDNAKPSEAIKYVDTILEYFGNAKVETMTLSKCNILDIKQALIKSQEIEKENAEYKRALEIIREKNVSIFWIKECKSLKEYNYNMADYMKLTQEEFDLLKRYFGKNIQE